MGSGDESNNNNNQAPVQIDPSYGKRRRVQQQQQPTTTRITPRSTTSTAPALSATSPLSSSSSFSPCLPSPSASWPSPAASRASFFVFDPATSSCVFSSFNSLSLSSSSSSSSPFLKDLSWTLVVTLILAGPIALAVLWLLQHYAKQVVYAALPFFILIPAFVNVYWFATCALSHGCRHSFPLAYRILALIFIFLLIAIILWIIVANRQRVELTVRIVRIAAAALASNMSLLAMLPALGLGLLVYFTPLVVFLVYSTWNGKGVPKEKEGASGRVLFVRVEAG